MRFILAMLAAGAVMPTATATTVTLDVDTCFDLDNNVEAEGSVSACTNDGDIRWGVNGGPPPYQALLWNEEFVDVGYVPKPYDDVTTLDVPDTAFCDFLNAPVPQCDASVHDQPWDPERTALVRTADDTIYRVRWVSFNQSTNQVTFEYSELPAGPPPPVFRFTQQGRLLDASGAPIQGTRTLAIDLFNAPTDGTEVWSKTFPSTPFADGFFAVTLTGMDDDDRSLDTIDDADLYMAFRVDGVTVGDRQRLGMAPAAARTHGAALIDASAPCSVVGGLGYDANDASLYLCTGSTWQAVGLVGDQEPSCPDNMIALGSSCISPSIRASDHWDDAVTDCMNNSGRLCSAGEMVYACKQRDTLNLGMPDTEWMWLDSRNRPAWTNNRTAAANHVYRRQGNTCFERTASYDSSPLTISWDWGSVTYRYYCCADPR